MSHRDPHYDEPLHSTLLTAPARDAVNVVRRLVRDMAIEAGLQFSALQVGEGQVVGQFRPRRMWNCVATLGSEQLAAIHVVRFPAAKASHRTLVTLTDELLGRALDASTATGTGPLRPWLGYLLLLEHCDFWTEHPDADDAEQSTHLVETVSRSESTGLFVESVVAARLLDVACVVVVDRTRAEVTPATTSLSFGTFAASFAGRCLSFATVNSSR
jgi:hypothetical protein